MIAWVRQRTVVRRMGVSIVPDAETAAVLRLKALEAVPASVETAFNGVPFDYHHAAWWFEEMGIADKPVAKRWLSELRDVGLSVAMSGLDVMERSVCVRKHSESGGQSSENKG